MISKINRLSEREVKKVLTRWKPFFSYGIVLNYLKNTNWNNRFAIVIWSKSVTNNVTRNYFRRLFYSLVQINLVNWKWVDFVFVVKKKTKLDKKDENSINLFKKDINFLINKLK